MDIIIWSSFFQASSNRIVKSVTVLSTREPMILSRTTIAIPLDIIECIIDILAIDKDASSLRVVSETCHILLPLCRRHTFATVHLPPKSDNSRHFNELVSTRPDISQYAQVLQCCLVDPGNDDQQVLDALQKHAQLRAIHLWSPDEADRRGFDTDWRRFPASVRSSLLSLIQLPTITHLEIRCFTNFPATAFLHCRNLIDLEIERLKLTPSKVENAPIIPRPISLYAGSESCDALNVLLRIAGPEDPIVDLSLLRRASFVVETVGGIHIVQEIMKTTTQLQRLSLDIDTYGKPAPVTLAGLGASLSAKSCWALKSATFRITVEGDSYDPLCGLNIELKRLPGNNVLEEVELFIDVLTDAPCRTQSDDWADFDAVLTGPGFSALRRVLVQIEWGSFVRNTEEVENVLKSLTAERFPRLSESITVMFEFSAQHVYV